jgi:hypothetical protein
MRVFYLTHKLEFTSFLSADLFFQYLGKARSVEIYKTVQSPIPIQEMAYVHAFATAQSVVALSPLYES